MIVNTIIYVWLLQMTYQHIISYCVVTSLKSFFFQIYTFMSTSAFIVHFFYAFVISPFGCLSTLLAFHKTIEMRGKAKHMAHSAP